MTSALLNTLAMVFFVAAIVSLVMAFLKRKD
jgi:hypothetical protein